MSIRATVVALIVYAACKIGKTAIVDKPAALLVGITLALLYSAEILYIRRCSLQPARWRAS
nr:hypothetical protein [Paenibacillus cisolokensis]